MPEEEKEQTKINARIKTKHRFILDLMLTVLEQLFIFVYFIYYFIYNYYCYYYYYTATED